MIYRILADLVLAVHVLFVLFVVAGLALVLLGRVTGWSWVRNPWFRLAHIAAILVVVLQAWLGILCPLTAWEQSLRGRAGDATYDGSFIAHWVHELLFYDAPTWVFTIVYTAFAALVVASWWLVPPRRPGRRSPTATRGEVESAATMPSDRDP